MLESKRRDKTIVQPPMLLRRMFQSRENGFNRVGPAQITVTAGQRTIT